MQFLFKNIERDFFRPKTESFSVTEGLELNDVKDELTEDTPLETIPKRTMSKLRLARQTSFMDTQKDSDGSIKITYWF